MVTGRIVPRTTIEITCKASGTVVAVPVQPSTKVKKGDLLLELDPREETRNRQRARVAVASAQARLEQARLTLAYEVTSLGVEQQRATAALAAATIVAEDARERAARLGILLEKRLAAAEEADGAKREKAGAESSLIAATLALQDLDARERLLESWRRDVTLAESAVEEAELSLTDAEQRLADTRVTAPIDGTVTWVNVEAGQIIASAISTVGAGTAVMNVVDLAQLQVMVNVPEADIGRIAVGQKASVGTDAYPGRRFLGVVQRIAAQGGRAEDQQNITYEVLVQLDGLDLPLRPRMSAVIELTTLDVKDAVTVPAGAIIRAKGKTTVQVRISGKDEERPVILGGSDGVNQQILDGVSVGDLVIIPEKGTSRWRPKLEIGDE
jgi:HlyD family secretion protein